MIIGDVNINIYSKENINIGINIDPNKPTMVLFGLIAWHSLVSPKSLPEKYPDVSVIVISDIRNKRYK
tara:strand:- start:80 stop:283 length:204 start_codon:yes stop_codon:yes gene_type:complete